MSSAIINFLRTSSLKVFTYHELVSALKLNAIYVSVYFAMSYFFLLNKTVKNKFVWIGMSFLVILIMLLSSKMVIVLFLIGNVIYGIKEIKRVKLNHRVFIIAFVLVAVTSSSVINRLTIEFSTNVEEVMQRKEFTKVYPWTGTSIRILQLRNLKEQIMEDKILLHGYGLFASRKDLKRRHQKLNTYPTFHEYNYHNMYAQILSELGLPGLLLLLFMLISGIAISLRERFFLMLIFFFMMTVIFLTESFLWVHRGAFFFVILYCIFVKSDFSHINIIKGT